MVSKKLDKSHRQNVKQEVHVKVHIGDKKKKAKRRAYRRRGNGERASSNATPYIQPYQPVYIQSGNPSEYSLNPLISSIQDLANNMKREYVSTPAENPLLQTVKTVPYKTSSPVETPSPVVTRREKDFYEEDGVLHYIPNDDKKPQQSNHLLSSVRNEVRLNPLNLFGLSDSEEDREKPPNTPIETQTNNSNIMSETTLQAKKQRSKRRTKKEMMESKSLLSEDKPNQEIPSGIPTSKQRKKHESLAGGKKL